MGFVCLALDFDCLSLGFTCLTCLIPGLHLPNPQFILAQPWASFTQLYASSYHQCPLFTQPTKGFILPNTDFICPTQPSPTQPMNMPVYLRASSVQSIAYFAHTWTSSSQLWFSSTQPVGFVHPVLHIILPNVGFICPNRNFIHPTSGFVIPTVAFSA